MSEEQDPQTLTVCLDPEGFRVDVQDELKEQLALLRKVHKALGEVNPMHAIAIALLAISAVFIFIYPEILFFWVIIGILLYSYNYLILFLPTTTDKNRPFEKNVLKSMGKYDKWFVIRLLSKKRKLAIEVGLTVFLGGMVPLVLSFSIIFGLALFFAIYFAAIVNVIEWRVAIAVVLQIVMILGFFFLVYMLEPESQGITRFARTLKGRYSDARTEGRMALVLFLMIIVLIVMVCALLVIGAMLLPGFTLGTMWFHLGHLSLIEFLSLILVLVVQIFVMRHFQALSSRSMALRLVNMRIDIIRTKVLAPLDALMLRSDLNEEQFEAEFFIIRRTFYSVAIYDVFESDLFGRSPVFLVGPRLKFLLDDKVLNHFHDKASEQHDHR